MLVSASGQHVRIADLGASTRLRGQQTGAGELAGQLIGTVAFTAPEVLRGEHYGRSADMWSCGCCVLEMATARFPVGRAVRRQPLRAHLPRRERLRAAAHTVERALCAQAARAPLPLPRARPAAHLSRAPLPPAARRLL